MDSEALGQWEQIESVVAVQEIESEVVAVDSDRDRKAATVFEEVGSVAALDTVVAVVVVVVLDTVAAVEDKSFVAATVPRQLASSISTVPQTNLHLHSHSSYQLATARWDLLLTDSHLPH